jgi:negative regulator of flagellin synthesis FlgM
MRISGAEVHQVTSIPRVIKPRPEGAADAASVRPKLPDQVELSKLSQDIARVQKVLAEVPDVRSEKIEEITAKIAAGEYKPKADEIADMILRRATADSIEE